MKAAKQISQSPSLNSGCSACDFSFDLDGGIMALSKKKKCCKKYKKKGKACKNCPKVFA